jgi:serine/threonine-protein kinase
VTSPQPAVETNGTPPSDSERLDSWKEIAAYLKRDVATVRRWEKREGLPVHRHLHEKQGSVFAFTSELNAWGEGRRRQVEEPAPAPRPAARTTLLGVAAGVIGLGLAMLVISGARSSRLPLSVPLQFTAELDSEVSLAPLNVQFGEAAVLSPDGTIVAFVAQRGVSRPQLYIRRLSQLQASPLSGTDDAVGPFFSPNGAWIGFFANGKLKKIAVTGSAPITLTDAPSARGGSWSDDDTIVFSPHSVPGTYLLRVPADGGTASPLMPLGDGEIIQAWPQVLPGGNILYTSGSSVGSYNNANIVVQVRSGVRKVLQKGGYHGRYLPSGHLVFIHDGTLFAVPFDLDRLEVTGTPAPAVKRVTTNSLTGGAQFTVSTNGMLAYLPGESVGAGNPIQWMDHAGKTAPLRAETANWINPRFAPDGHQLAIELREEPPHIWIYEWARDTLTRLTSDPIPERRPVWTPDGRRIAFASPRGTLTTNLYWHRADGTGETQRLTESTNAQQPSSWHPNGRFLAFEEISTTTKTDVMILPLEGDDTSGWKTGKPTALLNGPWDEFDPMFSPDGRWLAYASMESGRPEVYVQPFQGSGGRRLIGAGTNPTWSRTNPELFYGIDGQIMVAAYTVERDSFHSEKPRLWSEGRYQTRGSIRMFDLHPDGQRFALAAAVHPAGGARDKLVFFLNFFDELRRIMAASTK